MNNLKITEIFKTFSSEEFRQFEKLVISPYFNTSKLIEKYFFALKKFYPAFDVTGLKEYVFAKVYPDKAYNDQVMRNLNTEMMKLVEEFLLRVNLNKTEIETNINVIDEMQYRGLFEYSLKKLKKLTKDVEKAPALYDKNYFYLRYRIGYLTNQHFIKSNNQDKNENPKDEGIFRILYFLYDTVLLISNNFVSWYNKNSSQRENASTIFANCIFNKSDISEFIEYLRNKTDINPFPVEVFYYFVSALTLENGSEYYVKLKKLILENIEELSHLEKFNLFIDLNILSTKLHNIDKSIGKNESFEITKLAVEHNAYKMDPNYPIRINYFRSTIMNGLKANEIEWLEKFINEYVNELPEEHRANMYNYSLAHLSFAKKQFELSLEYLSKVEIKIFAFKTDIKVLQLLLYFELGYYEEAISLLDSFRHFLANTKNLVDTRKYNEQKFIHYYNELLKKRTTNTSSKNGRKEDLEILKHELGKEEAVRFKEWLLGKIDEILMM